MAVLETIEKENLQKHAFETGKYFLKILRELKEECPLIGDVRGTGLFIGVELVRDRKTLEPATEETFFVVENMKERQVLLSVDGPLRNVIKIKPPLPFNRKNAELVRDGLRRELKALNWAKADRCLI
jgi:4-aminobutyrate aminotransferase-like enzyme